MQNHSVRSAFRFFVGCSIASLAMLAVLPFLAPLGLRGDVALAVEDYSSYGGYGGSSSDSSYSGSASGGVGASGSASGSVNLGGSSNSSFQSQPNQGGGYSSGSSGGISVSGSASGGVGVSGSSGGSANLGAPGGLSQTSGGGNNNSSYGGYIPGGLAQTSGGGNSGSSQQSTPKVTASASTFSSGSVISSMYYIGSIAAKNPLVSSFASSIANTITGIFSGGSSSGYGGYIPGGTSIPSSVSGSPTSLGQTVTANSNNQSWQQLIKNPSGNTGPTQPSTGFGSTQSQPTAGGGYDSSNQSAALDALTKGVSGALSYVSSLLGGGAQPAATPTTVNDSKQDNGYVGAPSTVPVVSVTGSVQGGVAPGIQTSISVQGTQVQSAALSADQKYQQSLTDILAKSNAHVTPIPGALEAKDIQAAIPLMPYVLQEMAKEAALKKSPTDLLPVPDIINKVIVQRGADQTSVALFNAVTELLPKDSVDGGYDTNASHLNQVNTQIAQAYKQAQATPVASSVSTQYTVTSPAGQGGTVINGAQPVQQAQSQSSQSSQSSGSSVGPNNGGWGSLVKTVSNSVGDSISSSLQSIGAWAAPGAINSAATDPNHYSSAGDYAAQGVDSSVAPALVTTPDQPSTVRVQVPVLTQQLQELGSAYPKLNITPAVIQKFEGDATAKGYTPEQLYGMTLQDAQDKGIDVSKYIDLSPGHVVGALGLKAFALRGVADNKQQTVGQLFSAIDTKLGVTPPQPAYTTQTVMTPGKTTVENSNAVTSAIGQVALQEQGQLGTPADPSLYAYAYGNGNSGTQSSPSPKSSAGSGSGTSNATQASVTGNAVGDALLSPISIAAQSLGIQAPSISPDLLSTDPTKLISKVGQLITGTGNVLPNALRVAAPTIPWNFITTYPIQAMQGSVSIGDALGQLGSNAFIQNSGTLQRADAFSQAATEYGTLFGGGANGVDIANLITAQARFENANFNSAGTGSARGVGQFIPETWNTQLASVKSTANNLAANGTPSEQQAAQTLLDRITALQQQGTDLRNDPQIVAAVMANHIAVAPAPKDAGVNKTVGAPLYTQIQQVADQNGLSVNAVAQMEHFGTGFFSALRANPNSTTAFTPSQLSALQANNISCSGGCTPLQAARIVEAQYANAQRGNAAGTADTLVATNDRFVPTGSSLLKGVALVTTKVVDTVVPGASTALGYASNAGSAPANGALSAINAVAPNGGAGLVPAQTYYDQGLSTAVKLSVEKATLDSANAAYTVSNGQILIPAAANGGSVALESLSASDQAKYLGVSDTQYQKIQNIQSSSLQAQSAADQSSCGTFCSALLAPYGGVSGARDLLQAIVADQAPVPAVSSRTLALQSAQDYLFQHYQTNQKDVLAAQHAGMSLKEYVIGGINPEMAVLMADAGKAMEATGIPLVITSGFRDNYRQSLVDTSGPHAAVGNSYHGNSNTTAGYGDGKAIDISGYTAQQWMATNGATYGLAHPYGSYDAPHVALASSPEALARIGGESPAKVNATYDAVVLSYQGGGTSNASSFSNPIASLAYNAFNSLFPTLQQASGANASDSTSGNQALGYASSGNGQPAANSAPSASVTIPIGNQGNVTLSVPAGFIPQAVTGMISGLTQNLAQGSLGGSTGGNMISGALSSGLSSTIASGLGGIFTTVIGNFISKVIATGGSGPGTITDNSYPQSGLATTFGSGSQSSSSSGNNATGSASHSTGTGTGAVPAVAQRPDVSCSPQTVSANQNVTITVGWTCYNSTSANGIGFPLVNGLTHAQAQISTTTSAGWLVYGVRCSNGTVRSCLVEVK